MTLSGAEDLEGFDLKLLNLTISKCSSEGDFKSALKEIVAANPAKDSELGQKIAEFMKTQFRSGGNSSAEECSNMLLFIKTLVELPIPPAAAGVSLLQQPEDQPVQNELQRKNDSIYDLVIGPALKNILDHMNTGIYAYCQRSINELTSSDSNALSTHQLLALVHKTVRTTICLLKRIVSSPSCEEHSIGVSMHSQLRTLEVLLSDLMRNSVFELPLDVKCNAGLVLCYILKIRGGESLEKLETLKNVFTRYPNPAILGKEYSFLRDIPDVIPFEVNRIAIMFGVLGVAGNLDAHFKDRMKIMGEFILSIDHGTKESINLGTARVLEIWAEKMAHTSPATMNAMASLYTELEFFIFSNIVSHIDAVKNCCRNMLRNLTKMYDQMEDTASAALVKALLEKVLGKPFHVKWVGISCISVSSPKSICILDVDKDMPEQLLSSERTLKHCASDAYLSLMSHHFLKTNISNWESIWLDPLFREQISKTAESNWPQKRIIISLILKSKQDEMIQAVLNFIVRTMNSVEVTSTCVESSLLAAEAVKIASELNVKIDISLHQADPVEFDSFRGIVPRKVLHSWVWSSSPEVRLAGFSLLVETRKTSELIPEADLESLKILIQYNSVCQEPAFRQQFMSYYKKMLKRIRDSKALIIRNRDAANLKNYDDFFQWLWNCFTEDEGLFPGANFGRRCQALECLVELITIFDLKSLNMGSSEHGLKYLRWLIDSYENNKAMAFRILEKLDIPELENAATCANLFDTALSLCESIKPPDSLTGRYLCVFLIKKCPSLYSAWSILATAYDKLDQLYKDIQTSTLIEIASQTQMYGYFRLIRMIFDETNDFLQDCGIYREFVETLVQLCFRYDEILLPVLGSAAPEGFLPGLPDSEPKNSQVVRSINAQMLLVCSWRSMKDVCLLLTEMCVVLPLEGEGETDDFIISYDQVVSIGDHLLFLLKNLMHRGVFEQVYIGFRQLAQRLFRSSSRKLNELPEKWLNGAMDEELISSKCTTRRSAGLPFIFQALLAPVSSNEVFIAKYVNKLFEHDSKSNSGLVRIHCTNVLRGLFRDANFSRAIMPYVPDGLRLSFKGLKATDWNERNAGLMLFGAVIRRTFGPKLNLMSAPTFFRKFPEMYDFLLREIKACCFTLRGNQYAVPADYTYHVLILLSSFASKGVVEDGHFKLAEFIPYIHFCGSSPDSQVRAVAARALIPFLIHPDSKINFILCILNKTTWKQHESSNTIHGNLVQILTILETIPADEDISEVTETFNSIFNEACWLLTSKCPMIYDVLADICIKLGPAIKSSHEIIQKKFAVAFEPGILERKRIPGLPNADEKLSRAKVVFEVDTPIEAKVVFSLIQTFPDPNSLEQLMIVLCEKKYLHERVDDNDSVVLEAVIETYLRLNFEYVAQSTAEEAFLEFLSQVDSKTYADWVEYNNDVDVDKLFERLYTICVQGFGTLECKETALIVLGKLVFGTSCDLSKWHTPFCETLSSWCDPVTESDLRYAVACCIPSMPYNEFESFTVLEQCRIWFCILTLTQDDDSFIRTEISSKLNQVGRTCDRKSAEIFVQLFLETFTTKHSLEGLVLLVGLVLRDDFAIKMVDADDVNPSMLEAMPGSPANSPVTYRSEGEFARSSSLSIPTSPVPNVTEQNQILNDQAPLQHHHIQPDSQESGHDIWDRGQQNKCKKQSMFSVMKIKIRDTCTGNWRASTVCPEHEQKPDTETDVTALSGKAWSTNPGALSNFIKPMPFGEGEPYSSIWTSNEVLTVFKVDANSNPPLNPTLARELRSRRLSNVERDIRTAILTKREVKAHDKFTNRMQTGRRLFRNIEERNLPPTELPTLPEHTFARPPRQRLLPPKRKILRGRRKMRTSREKNETLTLEEPRRPSLTDVDEEPIRPSLPLETRNQEVDVALKKEKRKKGKKGRVSEVPVVEKTSYEKTRERILEGRGKRPGDATAQEWAQGKLAPVNLISGPKRRPEELGKGWVGSNLTFVPSRTKPKVMVDAAVFQPFNSEEPEARFNRKYLPQATFTTAFLGSPQKNSQESLKGFILALNKKNKAEARARAKQKYKEEQAKWKGELENGKVELSLRSKLEDKGPRHVTTQDLKYMAAKLETRRRERELLAKKQAKDRPLFCTLKSSALSFRTQASVESGEIPENVSLGLAYFNCVDDLFLEHTQYIKDAVVSCNTKVQTTYSFLNKHAHKVFRLEELPNKGCCRSSDLIARGYDAEIMYIRFVYSNGFHFSYKKAVNVFSPATNFLGNVAQKRKLNPYYEIRDDAGGLQATIQMENPNCCFFIELPRHKKVFTVMSRREEKIGEIRGNCQDLKRYDYGRHDVFGIFYLIDVGVVMKALIMGAATLIYRTHFDGKLQRTKVIHDPTDAARKLYGSHIKDHLHIDEEITTESSEEVVDPKNKNYNLKISPTSAVLTMKKARKYLKEPDKKHPYVHTKGAWYRGMDITGMPAVYNPRMKPKRSLTRMTLWADRHKEVPVSPSEIVKLKYWADEERLFDRSEMNNYNEPVHFAKLVIAALSKHPHQIALFKTQFHEALLSSELVQFYESITNSNLKSNESMTLARLCKFNFVEHDLTDFSDFNDPSAEKALVQAFTHKCIWNIFT